MHHNKNETKEVRCHGADEATNAASACTKTPVGRMFDGRSVFITGASGFIGRVLLEKLIRTYLGIKCIYILIRNKKNQKPSDRLHKELLNAPIFNEIRLRPDGSKLLDKIVVIGGDISEPNLGISEEDMQTLLNDESLSIVFHSAATTRFDEPLRVSVKLNLIATKEVIALSRRLPNLISLCHVSTAYVNSDITDGQLIEEKVYPIDSKPEQLINMVDMMDETSMQMLKNELVGRRPNTYTYTKALSERMIVEEAHDLPVAIVRPSIVVAAWKQPLPGWIDNLNGPTGLILGIGKGLCRSLHMVRETIADMIPVDVAVNTMIASAFYVAVAHDRIDSNGNLAANRKNSILSEIIKPIKSKPEPSMSSPARNGKNISCSNTTNKATLFVEETRQSVMIVHCNSGQINPITWGRVEQMFFPLIYKYPSCQVLRYPGGTVKSNSYHDLIARIFVHYLPALILDMSCYLMGKNAKLLHLYGRLHNAIAILKHFCVQNYNFDTISMKLIHASLTEADQRDLYIDIENLNWYDFWSNYTLGVRRYILKEEDSTLPKAHESLTRAYRIEVGLRVVLVLLIAAYCLPQLRVLSTIAGS